MGEWNVERILNHRWVGGKPQFLTKWENSPQVVKPGNLWATLSTGILISSPFTVGKRFESGSGRAFVHHTIRCLTPRRLEYALRDYM